MKTKQYNALLQNLLNQQIAETEAISKPIAHKYMTAQFPSLVQ
jgi:hypothetical protein